MKIWRTVIAGVAFVGGVWIASDHFLDGWRTAQAADIEKAKYYAVARSYEADTAKQQSIKAYTDLEAKRTTVQHAVRQMVMAEYRKCTKGRCK